MLYDHVYSDKGQKELFRHHVISTSVLFTALKGGINPNMRWMDINSVTHKVWRSKTDHLCGISTRRLLVEGKPSNKHMINNQKETKTGKEHPNTYHTSVDHFKHLNSTLCLCKFAPFRKLLCDDAVFGEQPDTRLIDSCSKLLSAASTFQTILVTKKHPRQAGRVKKKKLSWTTLTN